MYKNKICKSCGNDFTPNSPVQLFCSKECKDIYNKENSRCKNKYNYVCANCGSEIKGRYKAKSLLQFCNKQCQKDYYRKLGKLIKCIVCNNEFVQLHKNHVYCSDKCKQFYKNQNPKTYDYTCTYCGDNFTTTSPRKTDNKFCSRKCFNSYRSNLCAINKLCEYCNKLYKASYKGQRFCGTECQHLWQSEFRVGKNSSTYNHDVSDEERTICCEYCNKTFITSPKKTKTQRFCSNECRQSWYANVFSQSDEWKEISRQRAVKILSDGLINKIYTEPQIILNELLNSMHIEYTNEYSVKYYSIDNYLCRYDLFVEVMGDYWHCNSSIYEEISYKHQKDRIIRDRSKHTYILNNYNKEILYLWEYDLKNNFDVCKELLQLYIINDGILNNYHSFNYSIIDSKLAQSQIIVPYCQYNINEINSICKFVDVPPSA